MSDSNITFKQIEAFYWAANLGSFSIAATRLHVTQSSLSKRIAELEDAIGAKLFDRSGRRAHLTQAGQRLVAIAGQMLELKKALKAQVSASAQLIGVCRFGVSELASLTWLPELIRVIRKDHPDLVLEPYVDLARKLERRVLRGELDFSVAPGPADNVLIHGHVVGRVEFSWIASPARIPARSVLSADELERHPVQLVARVVDDPTVLVTRAENKITTLPAVIAALKQQPGSLSFGHNGVGTNGELALQMLSKAAGVEINAIPYKGTAAQKTDVLGGHLSFGLVSAAEIPELHNGASGQLRAVAQFVEKRSAALPQVPTAAEAGIKVNMSSERGFAVPKAVPGDIVKKLDAAIAQSMRDPAFIASASSDAPVLAYLAGPQWRRSLDQNRKSLQPLAAAQPRQ